MYKSDRPGLRAATLLTGFLTLAVGILFLAMPAVAKVGNEWIIATLFICGAITNAGFSITTLRTDVRVYTILLTALSLATGVIILVNPLDTYMTLTTLFGMYFILESALFGGLGMSLRPNWLASFWLFATSAISFVMSVLIWLRLAGSPKSVIITLIGISFIARGVLYIALSLIMRGRAPLPPASNSQAKEGIPNQV